MAAHPGPAWKQAERFVLSRSGHGNRLERCELEQAGRIMRAQAERKQVFHLIQPILTDGFIRPKEEKRPAGKNRKTIKEAIELLQKTLLMRRRASLRCRTWSSKRVIFSCEKAVFPQPMRSFNASHSSLMGCSPMLVMMEEPLAGYRLAFDKEAKVARLSLRAPMHRVFPKDWHKRVVRCRCPTVS